MYMCLFISFFVLLIFLYVYIFKSIHDIFLFFVHIFHVSINYMKYIYKSTISTTSLNRLAIFSFLFTVLITNLITTF